MKLTFISFVCMVSLVGCATSPLDPQTSMPVDFASMTTMALSGAAGGYIGNSIFPGGIGAAAGTGIGMLGAAMLTDQVSKSMKRQQAEAFEAGKRTARTEVMEQYWYDQTTEYNPEANRASGANQSQGIRPTRDLRYDPAVQEGVRYDSSFKTAPVGPYETSRGNPYLGSESVTIGE